MLVILFFFFALFLKLSSKAKFKDNVTPINLACQDDKALM